MCILSECCGSDTAISDLLKWFLVPSLQCNPILISQLVLVKPKVGEKGWGTGLMYAHQFLNSFFMFPGMKAHAAWLIYESQNIHQSLLPPAPAVSLGLSHWKSQALSRSRAARQQPGDLFTRLLQGLFSQTACPLHSALYQCVHLSSWHTDPTFDRPCQPSPPHHSPSSAAHTPATFTEQLVPGHNKPKPLPPFKTLGATLRRCDHLTQGVLWLLLIPWNNCFAVL